MKVKCFECAALIDAGDSDAVARAFIAHGKERHAWSYPEEAIRNYARNYVTGCCSRNVALGSRHWEIEK